MMNIPTLSFLILMLLCGIRSEERFELGFEIGEIGGFPFNTSLGNEAWYLDDNLMLTMGVRDVWDLGYNGSGVSIAIVDAGTDLVHIELFEQYNFGDSYDFVDDKFDAGLDRNSPGLGVECAGLAVGTNSTGCVKGIAYGASYVSLRVRQGLPTEQPDDETIAKAVNASLNAVDIYSSSWGPIDDGKTIDDDDKLGPLSEAAIQNAINTGRDGKGSIFLFSSGSGGDNFDDCNLNGYVSSPYTIAIGTVDVIGSTGTEGEPCASILAVTYGGRMNQTVKTTAYGSTCTDFYGSEAATPIAAGIIALMLEANPNLTWRDVQHLIVKHAQPFAVNFDYTTNGAGKLVNHDHGFGLMDAKAMVTDAVNWTLVPQQTVCESELLHPSSYLQGTGTITETMVIDNCAIVQLEYVTLFIHLSFYYRETTEVWLISPSGTRSRMMRERFLDNQFTPFTINLGSVHFWGEHTVGTWSVELISSFSGNEMIFFQWQLILRGTKSPTTASTTTTTTTTTLTTISTTEQPNQNSGGAGSDNDDEENDSWTPATTGAYVIGAAAMIGVIGVGAFVVVKAKAAAAVAAGGANMMGNGNVIGNTHFSPGQRQTSVVELGN